MPAQIGPTGTAKSVDAQSGEDAPGKLDEGVHISGDDYIAIPHTPALDVTNAWTICAWVFEEWHEYESAIFTG